MSRSFLRHLSKRLLVLIWYPRFRSCFTTITLALHICSQNSIKLTCLYQTQPSSPWWSSQPPHPSASPKAAFFRLPSRFLKKSLNLQQTPLAPRRCSAASKSVKFTWQSCSGRALSLSLVEFCWILIHTFKMLPSIFSSRNFKNFKNN